ncbi:MAG: alanine racemase [Actinomycetota bacterium]|nr:alanine racemase [Actinomycetota bacterium]
MDTPAVLVDLDVVDSNLRRMQSFADRNGFALRPHIKSHKSIRMAGLQLELGARGLCVATTSEAEVMAATSSDDILLAYPIVGRVKLDRLADLAADHRLTLVTDSDEVTEGYGAFARRIGTTVPVMVEVDTGMGRAGTEPRDVPKRAQQVEHTAGLRFAGIMTHAGHAHDVEAQAAIAAVARLEARIMGDVRTELEAAGLDVLVVSAGSTITSPYLRAEDGITEIRPGTYIYNDLRTMSCFACTPDSVAASALATVVSVNGERVTVNAGGKTLTATRDDRGGYGYPSKRPDAVFTRMSEEHGVLNVPSGPGRLHIGQRLQILPVHVCVWMDLQAEVYGTRNGVVVERINVDAMRHSL